MNEKDKLKVRGIIKAYLLLKDCECSSRDIKDFINTNYFGLKSGGITSNELARVIGNVNGHYQGIFKDVWCRMDGRKLKYYYIE